MANPTHLEKLCEGPKAWNAWREASPNTVPDLAEIKLTLHQRQLGPSNGGPVDLHGADLEHASLPYATLSGADLEGARLIGADLTHARLDGARLNGADLTDAVLDQADLTGAELDQAVLFGADLSNTRNLTAAQLEAAFGDASTRLPGNLMAPGSWFAGNYDDEEVEDDYTGWGMASYEEPIEQSLYEVLGLTERAAPEEIRTAYRNLVKKLHPDLNPNDDEAQERFKRVTTAYRILNDAAQRQRYDRGEIDSEGRVNPEFEARQRFRRTAFRYYSAAAASFVVAIGALAAVWYMVLSADPEPETTIAEITVPTAPKRVERLIADPQPVRSPHEERRAELIPEEQPPEPAVDNAAPQAPDEATPLATAPGMAEPPDASDEAPPGATAATTSAAPAPQATPAPVVAPTPEAAPVTEASPPSPAEPDTAQKAAETPPAEPVTEPAAAPSSAEAAPPAPLAPSQPASPKAAEQTPPAPPPAEAAARPLSQPHQASAGQTLSSTPEWWTVAGFPEARPNGNLQPTAAEIAPGAGAVQPQHPTAHDIVSQVLRFRAFQEAMGKAPRALAAGESGVAPERRIGLIPDPATSALPAAPAKSQPRPPAAPAGPANPKRTPTTQQVAPQGPQRSSSHNGNTSNKPQPARVATKPPAPISAPAPVAEKSPRPPQQSVATDNFANF